MFLITFFIAGKTLLLDSTITLFVAILGLTFCIFFCVDSGSVNNVSSFDCKLFIIISGFLKSLNNVSVNSLYYCLVGLDIL